ncbi:aspartate:alanine exchanger family transporter [Gulosibacter molinativorax]|uniref:Transporter n=1 Tax=Gulosibacter molinativorax TaxID=256821 RepID=A0ABT7C5V7_9MICO|nr:TrkA C-terminal domain-containing protein [Gulosibacter molinativorax]MDJ1370598.1 transporter [Gulosibacter molinativorax]QUY61988.1 AspT/YidE/YbjL antiporter duplication domain-containing protein [Gulosibacter molinativorax]
MVDLLIASPLLTLFLTAALGTLLGAVPFGPLKFGAAGALFVGLAIGALDPQLGQGLELVQSIGLALFVYTVGLASGASFFQDLRRQTPLIIGGVVLILLFAVTAVAANRVFGLGGELAAGMMAGALTSTPALAAATSAAGGSAEPAVGYAIAYPVGVIVTMIIVTIVARRPLPAKNDPNPNNLDGLEACTVAVEHPMRVSEIPGIAEIPGSDTGEVRVSYLQRAGEVSVASPSELLREGDRVVVVGVPDAVRTAQEALGSRVEENLVHDRSVVDYRYFIVSNHELVGRTVAELLIPLRFDGKITRIRRGDHDLLPTAEMTLQLGDRVLVVVPRERFGEVSKFFGDSERSITEVDFFSIGLGIAIGVAIGLISVPLGGGMGIALGSAAGPLLIGLILGRMERTGPIVWTMPMAANLTIRQLGLVIFLAAVGLASGQAFAQTAFTLTGLTIAVIATVVLTAILLLLWWWNRVTGMSSARAAGAIAGFVGQPAILSHVNSLVDDSRTNSGYAALFAVGIIVKILLVQAVVAL